jgi:hypothetical protein
VIKKLFLILVLILILPACSNDVANESDHNQPGVDSVGSKIEEIVPETPLIKDFPVVEGAKLVEYFDYYGMYQYTFYTENDEETIRETLIDGLEDIGIIASGYNTSQFAPLPAKDISMVDGSKKGSLGYIIIHPEGVEDYGNVKGYTVVVSEIIFNYKPLYMEPIEVSDQEAVPVYEGAVLVEYKDNTDDFIPTKIYTYFVKIDYFSGLDETEVLYPEVKEIYDYYINYFEDNNYTYDIYPSEIDATKRNEHVIVRVDSYSLSGVLVGARIVIEIEE